MVVVEGSSLDFRNSAGHTLAARTPAAADTVAAHTVAVAGKAAAHTPVVRTLAAADTVAGRNPAAAHSLAARTAPAHTPAVPRRLHYASPSGCGPSSASCRSCAGCLAVLDSWPAPAARPHWLALHVQRATLATAWTRRAPRLADRARYTVVDKAESKAAAETAPVPVPDTAVKAPRRAHRSDSIRSCPDHILPLRYWSSAPRAG